MTQMMFLTLDVFQEYMLFSDNGESIHKCLNEISVLVKNELSAKLRLADIRSSSSRNQENREQTL